jgi:hypothetical protein
MTNALFPPNQMAPAPTGNPGLTLNSRRRIVGFRAMQLNQLVMN